MTLIPTHERPAPRSPARPLPAALAGVFVASVAGPLLAQSEPGPTPSIVVDQFGYVTDAEKVAVVRDPAEGFDREQDYAPGDALEVRAVDGDALAFSGEPRLWNEGEVHEDSGDRGWWFDFSALETPGLYYIVDPEGGARTGPFEIGTADAVYGSVLWDAARAFFYNRAGIAKTAPRAEGGWRDAASYLGPGQDTEARSIYAPDDPSTARDLRGGWFDAGDPNKYVTFAESPINDLLSSYRESTRVWRWYDLNIPESDNDLPDLLDEVKWELDWVLRMMNPDGSTLIKVGDSNANPGYASPPSANATPRYYAPVCTSSTVAAANMLAQAAVVFRDRPGQADYAVRLEDRAADAWTNAAERVASGDIETNCDDPKLLRAGDADYRANVSQARQSQSVLAASVWLFALNGQDRYRRMIERLAPTVRPLVDGYWAEGARVANDALLFYRTLPTASASVVRAIDAALDEAAVSSRVEEYGFDEDDLYRAEVPFYSLRWGSNANHASWGSLNHALADAGVRLTSGESLSRRATQAVHWFHGVNPFGVVWLSAMDGRGAERSVNTLHHIWFADGSAWNDQRDADGFGPAPGFLTGGPNFQYGTGDVPGTSSLSPPFGQPAYKSWLDANEDRAPNGERAALYAVGEPSISVQATYVRLLAWAITAGFPRED